MNPYTLIGSGLGTAEAVSLSQRLAAWHDAMVAHKRRLRAGVPVMHATRTARIARLARCGRKR